VINLNEFFGKYKLKSASFAFIDVNLKDGKLFVQPGNRGGLTNASVIT